MTKYHVPESCNRCGVLANKLTCVSHCEGQIEEAKTSCDLCGFEDYWAYGWFESGSYMESKCARYSFG